MKIVIIMTFYSVFALAKAANAENNNEANIAPSKLISTIYLDEQNLSEFSLKLLERPKRTFFVRKSFQSPSKKLDYMRRILKPRYQNHNNFPNQKYYNHKNYHWKWHSNQKYQPIHPTTTRPHISTSQWWDAKHINLPQRPTTARPYTTHTQSKGVSIINTTEKELETRSSSTTSTQRTTSITPEDGYIFQIDIR